MSSVKIERYSSPPESVTNEGRYVRELLVRVVPELVPGSGVVWSQNPMSHLNIWLRNRCIQPVGYVSVDRSTSDDESVFEC